MGSEGKFTLDMDEWMNAICKVLFAAPPASQLIFITGMACANITYMKLKATI
ncbi:hypothetical protein Fmac_003627 [Flemingia macrophylla]|uniref:Uncharacterized protein n=1 Tax=Flemingia macrophylla TaxID=520843 RepID=A0ABD1N2M0_9FABA